MGLWGRNNGDVLKTEKMGKGVEIWVNGDSEGKGDEKFTVIENPLLRIMGFKLGIMVSERFNGDDMSNGQIYTHGEVRTPR